MLRGLNIFAKRGAGKNITFLQQFCVGASEPVAINTQICCWDRPSGVRGPGQASQAESQGQIGSIQHSLATGGKPPVWVKYRERQRAKYPSGAVTNRGEINNPWNFENLSCTDRAEINDPDESQTSRHNRPTLPPSPSFPFKHNTLAI